MSQIFQGNYDENANIRIKEYLFILKKGIVWIFLVTGFFTAIGLIYDTYFKAPPAYESSRTVILGAEKDYISTLIVLAEDPLILGKVSKELGLNRSSDALAEQINVTSLNNSQVIKFSVVDSNPEMAVKIADSTVNVFKSELSELLDFNNIEILPNSEVEEPVKQIAQSKNRVLYTFAIGFIVSIGFVFLLDYLNSSVKTKRDVEKTLGVPLIGEVSNMSRKNIKTNRKITTKGIGSEKLSVNDH